MSEKVTDQKRGRPFSMPALISKVCEERNYEFTHLVLQYETSSICCHRFLSVLPRV